MTDFAKVEQNLTALGYTVKTFATGARSEDLLGTFICAGIGGALMAQIAVNVGMNLLKMDSTLNVNAVCEGIRDVFRAGAKLSADDAEVYYLRYMNYVLPEKARAYEEQFLADFAKSNRSYARTPSGVTYAVEVLGDQEQIPVSDRDSVHHPHGRRGRRLLLLRAPRHAAHVARQPEQRDEGEREADRQGREDQCMDAFCGCLWLCGGQRARDPAQCHALLRNRACRSRQIYELVAAQ